MKKALMVKNDELFLPALLSWLESEGAEIVTLENGVVGMQFVEEVCPEVIFIVFDGQPTFTQRMAAQFTGQVDALELNQATV